MTQPCAITADEKISNFFFLPTPPTAAVSWLPPTQKTTHPPGVTARIVPASAALMRARFNLFKVPPRLGVIILYSIRGCVELIKKFAKYRGALAGSWSGWRWWPEIRPSQVVLPQHCRGMGVEPPRCGRVLSRYWHGRPLILWPHMNLVGWRGEDSTRERSKGLADEK